MPNFDTEYLLKWLHFITLVLAGGSMPACLLISGFEDTNEDVRGLSAVLWKKLTVWGMRFAVFLGVALLIVQLFDGAKPFSQPHLMFVIGIAPFLFFLCETAPKHLAVGKRGTAMFATVLFVLVSFVASNGKAFFEKKPETIATPETTTTEATETPRLVSQEGP